MKIGYWNVKNSRFICNEVIYNCFSVWSDDTWLQEYAGQTLNKSSEEDKGGTKRPADDTDTVCGNIYCQYIITNSITM